MHVLFLGPKFGNSYLEYKALKRICKKVDIIDTNLIFRNTLSLKIFYHVAPELFIWKIRNFILSKIDTKYDLIYVRSGEYLDKNLLLQLKRKTEKIVFYCGDNPFLKRDKFRWRLFLKAAKLYDLLIFHQKSRIRMSKDLGLKKTMLVTPPYDKNIHIKKNNNKLKNNIVFIGTWFPERGIFFKKLSDLGLKFKIYGTKWNKDPNFENLKSKIKLGHVHFKNYAKIISKAKIAISLFSEQNIDDITRRPIEIAAIGTTIISKNTKSMKEIFKENKEAIYFNNANECYKKCSYLLKNTKLLNRISNNANIRVKKLKISNDDLIKKIIRRVQDDKN